MPKHTANKKLERELHDIKTALRMINVKTRVFDDIEERLGNIESQLTELKTLDKKHILITTYTFETSYVIAGITLLLTATGSARTIGYFLAVVGVVALIFTSMLRRFFIGKPE